MLWRIDTLHLSTRAASGAVAIQAFRLAADDAAAVVRMLARCPDVHWAAEWALRLLQTLHVTMRAARSHQAGPQVLPARERSVAADTEWLSASVLLDHLSALLEAADALVAKPDRHNSIGSIGGAGGGGPFSSLARPPALLRQPTEPRAPRPGHKRVPSRVSSAAPPEETALVFGSAPRVRMPFASCGGRHTWSLRSFSCDVRAFVCFRFAAKCRLL